VYEPEPSGPIRLKQRDRFALAYRVGGMILGLALLAWSIATSSSGPWTIALFVLVTVGGAISYHVLTSVIRCPGCNARKVFHCSRCGATAYLTEGFFWQTDFSG
jgi:hypothetical protein